MPGEKVNRSRGPDLFSFQAKRAMKGDRCAVKPFKEEPPDGQTFKTRHPRRHGTHHFSMCVEPIARQIR